MLSSQISRSQQMPIKHMMFASAATICSLYATDAFKLPTRQWSQSQQFLKVSPRQLNYNYDTQGSSQLNMALNIDEKKNQEIIRRSSSNSKKKFGFPLYSDITSSTTTGDAAVDNIVSLSPPFDGYQKQSGGVSFDIEALGAIMTSSLLITGNTVGAGMMILPDIAAGPGLASSVVLFFAIYVVNLMSGCLISEVAIRQYEESTDKSTLPSSFMDLADQLSLPNGYDSGMIVSAVSIMINWCVLAFALMRAGEMLPSTEFLSDYTSVIDTPCALASMFALFLTVLVSTQSTATLSKIASGAVTLLFLSFGSLLIPGLINMQNDAMTTLLAKGTATDWHASIASAAPIFLTTMVYQNIVPTVTKLLDFDRSKTRVAMAIGSGLPMLMYILWSFAVLGGGVVTDHGSGLSSTLLEAFAVASVGGSSLACVMSLSEEFESLFASKQVDITEKNNDSTKSSTDSKFDPRKTIMSLPSVLLGVLPPLVAGIIFSQGEEFTGALECAGAYGSPLLYGILPVMLAWQYTNEDNNTSMPGGLFGISAVGLSSIILIGQKISASLGNML